MDVDDEGVEREDLGDVAVGDVALVVEVVCGGCSRWEEVSLEVGDE